MPDRPETTRFDITETDIGRHVRRKSTGEIGVVSRDSGNGWLHPWIVYEWKAYRDDLEYVMVTSDMQTTGLDKAIGETITGMVRRFDNELYALTEAELAEQWYFSWNENGSPVWNLYQFSDMLEMHKRQCRRWEEHHNGSECVVERVRDKYLTPRIKAFMVELGKRGMSTND